MGIVDTITTAKSDFCSLHKVKKTVNANYIRFFLVNFLKNLCVNKRGTHEMRKFKSVNELVNLLKPDYPVYCIRPEEIKKSVKFFNQNFPGKLLYAVKTLSLIHISEPTRLRRISYAVFCLKKKKQKHQKH